LLQRLRGRWTPTAWNLGRWSLPVNILAAVLGTALTVNIAWPRGTAPWYDRYSGFLFVAGALVAALVYYVLGGPGARTAIDAPPLDTEGAGAEGAVAPGSEPAGSDVPVFTEPAV